MIGLVGIDDTISRLPSMTDEKNRYFLGEASINLSPSFQRKLGIFARQHFLWAVIERKEGEDIFKSHSIGQIPVCIGYISSYEELLTRLFIVGRIHVGIKKGESKYIWNLWQSFCRVSGDFIPTMKAPELISTSRILRLKHLLLDRLSADDCKPYVGSHDIYRVFRTTSYSNSDQEFADYMQAVSLPFDCNNQEFDQYMRTLESALSFTKTDALDRLLWNRRWSNYVVVPKEQALWRRVVAQSPI